MLDVSVLQRRVHKFHRSLPGSNCGKLLQFLFNSIRICSLCSDIFLNGFQTSLVVVALKTRAFHRPVLLVLFTVIFLDWGPFYSNSFAHNGPQQGRAGMLSTA